MHFSAGPTNAANPNNDIEVFLNIIRNVFKLITLFLGSFDTR